MSPAPLILAPCQPNKTLQQLIEDWAYEQDTGEVTALVRPPAVLSVQLMRFQGLPRGGSSIKCHSRRSFRYREGVETSPCAYVLHSVIYHIGCAPDSGHYRTLGVTNLLHEL